MKKIIALALALMMLLSMVACTVQVNVPEKGNSADEENKVTLTEEESTQEAEKKTEETKTISRGKITGDVYESEFNGLKFVKKANWTYFSDEEIAEKMSIGVSMIGADAFAQTAMQTLTVYDMMVIDPTTGNNISVGYENLMLTDSLSVTEEKYLEITRENLSAIETMNYEIDEEIKNVKLSGQDYKCLSVKAEKSGYSFSQHLYVRKLSGYISLMVVTAMDGTPASEFEAMFQ